MKPTRGRTRLVDTVKAGATSMALYASASPRALTHDALTLATVPGVDIDVVHSKRKPSGQPLEADIQREIIEYLLRRADIRCVTRINSGVMQEGNRFIRMNTVYGKQNGMYMKMADIQCIHWPSGRLVCIECKRGGFTRPSGKREFEQAAYLEAIREAGGIAGFATCIADVERLLA